MSIPANPPQKTAEQRKTESITRLIKEGIPYIDWLPFIESSDEVKLKSKETIAKRALTCFIAIQAAFDISNDNYTPDVAQYVLSFLEKFELQQQLTPNELAILNNQADQQDVVNMVWKYEAYWSLLWALGLVETLDFPDTIVNCDHAIDVVLRCDDFEQFMQSTKPRDIEEVLNEADLIYRYHWACVNARIKDEDAPKNMIESVVMERRAGLDWLFKTDADWDYPELST